jgi:hypothetical protein
MLMMSCGWTSESFAEEILARCAAHTFDAITLQLHTTIDMISI